MAKRRGRNREPAPGDDHEPLQVQRTRTSSTLAALTVGLIFLVLLIIFIAQNDKKVPIHFLGAYGHVSEALAIVASAVAGAVLVLAVGLGRVVQLRIGGRRHNRAVAKQQDESAKQEAAQQAETAKQQEALAALPPPVASASPAPESEAKPVETEGQA